MKKLSAKQVERLQESIKWSIRELDKPRMERRDSIRQFAGKHYSDDGSDKVVPVNIIALATMIYVRQLAARAPRAMLSTKDSSKKAVVADFELAINQIPAEIKLGDTMQRLVLEAIFSWGIVKVGLAGKSKVLGHSYGEPFVDIVSADDYFVDMTADHVDNIDYEGNDYWMDYDEVVNSDWVNKSAIKSLSPYEGEENDSRSEHTNIGNSGTSNAKRFKEKLRLRDVFLPDEKLLITYDIASEKVLRTVEWTGPSRGPYVKLKFTDVPGALLPLPPVSIWKDIHNLSNSLFRKLAEQADGQKSVIAFDNSDKDGQSAFGGAADGQAIGYQGKDPRLLATPGVDQKTLAFFLQTQDLGSHYAGNLDSLGGLGAQTDTVGQDKLIGEAAGAQLRDMAQKTIASAKEIFTALAFYEWSDPVASRLLEKPVPGMDGMTIPVILGPKDKKGSFDDISLDIDVYSLQDDSPSLRLQKLGQVMQMFIMPLSPVIEQAGGTINAQKILEAVARYTDLPEVKDLVTFSDVGSPESAVEGSGRGGGGKPANTTRTYERVSGGGPTRQGASASLQQALVGGDAGGAPSPAG